MLIKVLMQHWILCMSSYYCLSPFRKLQLKWVHWNLIQWISIIRLFRESPALTSLLISFTGSISHLSLAVLVSECQFWPLLRLKSADNGVDKDLGISDNWIADNVAFPIRSSHGVWQPSFSNYFEKLASLSNPKTWSSSTNTSIKSLTDEVLRACKTLLLGKRIKIRSRILVATSGRSCIKILLNICTITCVVASYVHYRSSFKMCRHSCTKFVIWLQIPLIVLVFFTFLLVLRIQHVILVLRLCRFKRSLYLSMALSYYYKGCKTLDADLGQWNYCASENGLMATSSFAAGWVL